MVAKTEQPNTTALKLMAVDGHRVSERFRQLCGDEDNASPELLAYVEGLAKNYLRFKQQSVEQAKNKSAKRVTQTNWSFTKDPLDSDVDIVTRHKLLMKHGNFSMAFSVAFQPHLRYFGDSDEALSSSPRREHAFTKSEL